MSYLIDLKERPFIYMKRESIDYPMHIQNSLEYVLVIKGTLDMYIASRKYRIPAGHAVFIEAFEPHSFQSSEQNVIYIFEYSPKLYSTFPAWLKDHSAENRMTAFSPDLLAYLKPLLPPSIESTAQRTEPHSYISQFHAQAIITAITQIFIDGCSFQRRENRQDDIFLNVLQYIFVNFTKDITLSSIAQHFGFHPDSLSRKFMEKSNMTIPSFIHYMRICHAATLLRGGVSIPDTAFRSGFGSIRTFNRVFKQFTGCTPTAYLRTSINDDVLIYDWKITEQEVLS